MTRKIGLVLLVVGGLMLTWVGATVTWGDPFTALLLFAWVERKG